MRSTSATGSPDEEIYGKSVSTLRSTVDTACAIGADGVVFHVGSHLGSGFDAGLDWAAPAIECPGAMLGHHVASDRELADRRNDGPVVEEIAQLIDRLHGHPRLGVCLDSCHLWASGVDVTDTAAFDALLDEFERLIGLDRLRTPRQRLGHAARLEPTVTRTSKRASSATVSRHFWETSAACDLPAIVETEGQQGKGADEHEIRKLRELHAADLARDVVGAARTRAA